MDQDTIFIIEEQREEFLDNLLPGEHRSGVVSSVVSFGAFVDLGGMDGLLPAEAACVAIEMVAV